MVLQEIEYFKMDSSLLRTRLRALRDKRGISQEALAAQMKLVNRQALTDIESGDRKIAPAELAAAAEALGTTVFALTDPLQLGEEGRFSWRQAGANLQELDSFEFRAGQWIAAFRHFNKLQGVAINSAVHRLGIDITSSYEDATAQGEALAAKLELGEIPAEKLPSVLEEQLSTLVLYVDAIEGVSGAACRIEVLNTILVNRREILARRNYDIAHEFFHLLTWETMPPQRLDEAAIADKKYKRIETLAENFASGLLMPTESIQKLVAANGLPTENELPKWISLAAPHMQVSHSAMLWRLVNLGYVTQSAATRVRPLLALHASIEKQQTPALFSKRYLQSIAWAIDEGEISVRRAGTLLNVPMENLPELFRQHQIYCAFEL